MRRKFMFMGLLLSFSVFLNIHTTEVYGYEYNDVKQNSSHYEGINYLFEEGFIGGFHVDSKYLEFRPAKPIIRSEVAAIFASVLDLPLIEDSEPFVQSYKDLDMNHPLILSIASNIEQGIFKGEGEYFMDTFLSREQMATVLVRAFNLTSSEKENAIGNLSNVSESHKDAVALLFDYKLTTEMKDFRPKEKVSRAQFITFLYRTMKIKGLENFTIDKNRASAYHSQKYGRVIVFPPETYFSDWVLPPLDFGKEMNQVYKKGTEYAIAYPNSFILLNNEREFLYILDTESKRKSITSKYRPDLPIYSSKLLTKKYEGDWDVPLPNDKTYGQLYDYQESKKREFKNRENQRPIYNMSINLFDKREVESSIFYIAHKIGEATSDKTPIDREELVQIINWTIETGEVYDGIYFTVSYDFRFGSARFQITRF